MNPAPHLNVALPYEDDAFISYRHLDNRTREGKGKGWIDKFHEDLTYQLDLLLGGEPKIWRDPEMPGNVRIDAHLHSKLSKTVILISFISSGYLKSNWCMGELREFCRLAEENSGLYLDGRLRIFNVLRLPAQNPLEFGNQTGYQFYDCSSRLLSR